MSLVHDFCNYYCNTWIALKEGNINHPLMIIDVRQNGDFRERDFSHEAEQAMYFVAQKWFKRDDGTYGQEGIEIPVFDPRLIHESPDVGYLSHGNNIVSWTHINPVRQRVKGLTGNKLRQIDRRTNVDGRVVYNLFNPEFEGLLTRFIFINPNNGRVYYKGCHVGQVDQQAAMVRGRLPCTLLEMFKHISPDFSGRYNVTLVNSL